ncbi:hypothetical protein F4859DRAFT_510253 [Xylaria cf. heliscus]|nr:hypothetical protein F4859DRAFT_510253 [Xylaria cf. heliscus]
MNPSYYHCGRHRSITPVNEELLHPRPTRSIHWSFDAPVNTGEYVMDNNNNIENWAAPGSSYSWKLAQAQQAQQAQAQAEAQAQTPIQTQTQMIQTQSQSQAQAQAHSLPAQNHNQLLALQQHRQSTPPRQYTTVGSVYNPHPHPLQPPVRRGRTIKSLYPYKAESPAGLAQVQYTPLQQNSDRAVSPVRQELCSLPSTLPITLREKQVLQKFGVIVPGVHQTPSLSLAQQSPAQTLRYVGCREANNGFDPVAEPDVAEDNTTVLTSASAASGDESDDTDTKPISTMNFNSLTNLASYPNPMQRAAQKLLASHRPQPVPSISSQISDSHSMRYDPEAEPFVSGETAHSFLSALPKGRGAPAPLTAGPPGVRQFRPTTFEQETLQRARDFDDETPMLNPYYHTRPPYGQHIGYPSFEQESDSEGEPVLEMADDDEDDEEEEEETDEEEGEEEEEEEEEEDYADDYDDEDDDEEYHRRKRRNAPVFDTLPVEEALKFFPKGLPPNFNHATLPVSCDWMAGRLIKLERQSNVHSAQCQESFWVERKRYIDNCFYSGSNMLNKPFDVAVSEHKHRDVARILGRPYQEPPNDQGKVINRQLPVRHASVMPVSEHAKPLLSMVFQAIANRPEISPEIKLPKFEESFHTSYLSH